MSPIWKHNLQLISSVHIMMTSSNGNIFHVTGPLCGEFTSPSEFPAQRPVKRGFDVFFDLRLNKRLSKQPWGWWFEMPSWSLWRHCNDQGMETMVPVLWYTLQHHGAGTYNLKESNTATNEAEFLVAKRSPNATYETVGQCRYYQTLVRLATQEFLLLESMCDRPRRCSHVWRVVIKSCIFFFQYFYVGPPQISVEHPTYQLGGPLGNPGFFVSCSTVHIYTITVMS